MLAIQMVGAVYCPLSSQDPEHRLLSLLQLTNSRTVFIHHQTKHKFHGNILLVDIDARVTHPSCKIDFGSNDLSSIPVTPESISYTIFTSGSTGKPKPVAFADLIT